MSFGLIHFEGWAREAGNHRLTCLTFLQDSFIEEKQKKEMEIIYFDHQIIIHTHTHTHSGFGFENVDRFDWAKGVHFQIGNVNARNIGIPG